MKRIILIGALCLSLSACVKDLGFKDVRVTNATPTYAAPIINTDFSMQDIVNIRAVGSYIELNSSGFLSLIYEKTDYSVFSSSWILIPDQSFNQSMGLSSGNLTFINGAPNGTSVTENYSVPLNFNFNPVEVDEILFKAGNLSLTINNNYNQSAMAIVTVPELTKAGVAFRDTLFMNPLGSASLLLPMQGYLGDFTAGVVGQWNRMSLNFSFMLTKSMGVVTGTGIDMNMGCSSMVFNTIKGYFGQQTISVPLGEIDINIFDNAASGTVNFQDPKIRLDIHNQLGMPAEITDINPFYATYKDNTTAPITGLNFPIQVAAAPAFNNASKTTILLDKNNSNFPAIVNNRPVKVTYQGSFNSNPQGKTATRNFSTDTSQVLIDGRVEFPLWGYAKDFSIADTFDLGLEEADKDKVVDWAMIRLNVTNGFPVEISTQGYFYDSITQTVVDSLFATPSAQQIIPGAKVDGSANVIGPTNKITDIMITGDRYRLLVARNGRKLILSVRATTSQNGGVIVKFFPDMRVNFKVGAKVKLTGNMPK